jgi:hypothetical protein
MGTSCRDSATLNHDAHVEGVEAKTDLSQNRSQADRR